MDWPPSPLQPATLRWVIATALAIALSLAADATLVALGTTIFPATVHYSHFQFDDYAKLTVIGVAVGCTGWPFVIRASSSPRWVFSRLFVLATLVLFLPDVWLLYRGQPPKEVAVLMTMHVAVALITYWTLVLVAPSAERPRLRDNT